MAKLLSRIRRPSPKLVQGMLNALVVLSLALVVFFATRLISGADQLGRVDNENIGYVVAQGEIQLLNFHQTLEEQISTGFEANENSVQREAEQLLDRLNTILDSNVSDMLRQNTQAEPYLTSLTAFRAEFAERIADIGALSDSELRALSNFVDAQKMDIRQLALATIAINSATAQTQRETVLGLLRLAILTTIVVLSGLMIFVLSLQYLLSESQRQEAEIQEAKRQLESTVAASLEAIITSNSAGTVIGFNEAAERILGWKKEEIIGTAMHHNIVPTQLRLAHVRGMSRHVETGERRLVGRGRREMTALRKDGEEIPIELNITSVETSKGNIYIAYLRDISDRKITEKTLTDARDRARQADRAKTQFLTVMSHEMRTPLNGVMGVLDLLRTTKLTNKQARYIDIATASSEILMEHVNEAIDATRIESGDIDIDYAPFHLDETLTGVVDALEPLALEKDLTLTLEMAHGIPTELKGDARRIRQIVTNLVGNALKFTTEGGIKIAVSAIDQDTLCIVEITVIDSGIGVEPEFIEDIFEDYFTTGSSSDRRIRSDGLGLPISRRIARQMGGDLVASSEVGKGSEFTVKLPLAHVDRSELDKNLPAPVPAFEPSSLNVLVIDDNSINRRILGDMIGSLGHMITTAENGREGVTRALEEAFDTIFMDINMPDIDGFEATERIRSQNGPSQNCTILGLTAYARTAYSATAEAAGMDQLYSKPLRLADLNAILTGVERMAPPKPNSPMFVDLGLLHELRDALGYDNTKNTGERFFLELDAFITDLRTANLEKDHERLSKLAHRNRGAAALLGFKDVCAQIDDLAEAIHSTNQNQFASSRARLANARDDAKRSFESFMDLAVT